ncbi:MAG: flagellar L-ring protein precursor FlgH [Gammaproteobacteria bacterium]|jgi:flagellar L-ring protein precursor FlgH
MNMVRFGKLAVIVAVAVLQACTMMRPASANDPAYAPVVPESMVAPINNPGGIYQPGFSRGLFADRRAMRVGDVLSVVLDERTISSKKADTEVKKDNAIAFDEATILGKGVSFGDYSLGTSISQGRDFSGESSSDQSNSLTGRIAVTVAEVLPNGLMVVRGEKWMTLNRGEEFIRVSGVVRPEDVEPDNSVSSTRLANARITYSGTGDLADSNKQGWASRFFNTAYWPF